MVNATARIMLNKVVPFMIARPAALQAGAAGPHANNPAKYDEIYREAVRSGHRTTAVLCSALAIAVLGLAALQLR